MAAYIPIHLRVGRDERLQTVPQEPVPSTSNSNPTGVKASKWANSSMQFIPPQVEAKINTRSEKAIEPTPTTTSLKAALDSEPSKPPVKVVKFEVNSSMTTNDSSSSQQKQHDYVKAIKTYSEVPVAKVSKPARKPSSWLTKEERKAMAAIPINSDDMTGESRIPYDDGGWGTQPQLDLNAPNQLLDWEGNIAPAPVEWDGRRACQRDNWCEFIVQYINESQSWFVQQDNGDCLSKRIEDTSHDLFKGDENGEVVPKDWITHKIENQPLQSFWKSLLQIVPEPIDQEDLHADPFWLRYELGTNILTPYEHAITRCQPVADDDNRKPNDDSYRLWLRSKKQTAHISIEEYLRDQDTKDKGKKRLRRKEKNKLLKGTKEPVISLPNPNRPRESIYLRPMIIKSDAQGVHDIYQHYANQTVYAPDLEAPTLEVLIERLEKINHTALPMLVAVQRPSKTKPSITADGKSREKILGFAYAVESEGRHTLNSHVANIELYVANEYQTKGIGKCLLDRMLYLLDPMYNCVTDAKWKPPTDKPEFSCPGGRRVVGAVRIVVHYGSEERSRLAWIREWVKNFGFVMEADFSQCGMKLGRWTRQAIFQRSTGSQLDPKTVIRSPL